MTTLDEAARKVLEAWQTSCYGKDAHQIAMVLAMADLSSALEQPAPQPAQGEPVYQYQMADGSWIDQIKDSYDYNRKYAPNATVRVVYTAAPAPQAQPAQASGRTNPGDETGGAVERFGWQTFLGKSPEIVPATNGSFVWYSDYLKLWQSAQPIGINGMVEAATRPAIDAASKQGGQHE